MRFARNPEAVLHWDNMTALAGLLDALDNEEGPDVNEIKKSIETIDFVEQPKKDLWASCIDASEYSTAYYSISGAFWSMAEELRALDPSSENRENYAISMAKQYLHRGTLKSNERLYKRIDDVKVEDIHQLANEILNEDRLFTLIFS
jgi:hypothetical protein